VGGGWGGGVGGGWWVVGGGGGGGVEKITESVNGYTLGSISVNIILKLYREQSEQKKEKFSVLGIRKS